MDDEADSFVAQLQRSPTSPTNTQKEALPSYGSDHVNREAKVFVDGLSDGVYRYYYNSSSTDRVTKFFKCISHAVCVKTRKDSCFVDQADTHIRVVTGKHRTRSYRKFKSIVDDVLIRAG